MNTLVIYISYYSGSQSKGLSGITCWVSDLRMRTGHHRQRCKQRQIQEYFRRAFPSPRRNSPWSFIPPGPERFTSNSTWILRSSPSADPRNGSYDRDQRGVLPDIPRASQCSRSCKCSRRAPPRPHRSHRRRCPADPLYEDCALNQFHFSSFPFMGRHSVPAPFISLIIHLSKAR